MSEPDVTSGGNLPLVQAHGHSSSHREEIERSSRCGCFYCLECFPPSEISHWVDGDAAGRGTTALCPRCGIDAVIGSDSGYPLTRDFLTRMCEHFFG